MLHRRCLLMGIFFVILAVRAADIVENCARRVEKVNLTVSASPTAVVCPDAVRSISCTYMRRNLHSSSCLDAILICIQTCNYLPCRRKGKSRQMW